MTPAQPTPLRLAEVLAAISLTTDLGAGMPFEKGLRTCVVASRLAVNLRLGPEQRRAVFHAALLRSIGCTAHAPENAAMFGDDLLFERAFKELDPADTDVFARRFGEWDPPRQRELLGAVIRETPTTGVYAVRSGCEVSAALGSRLGLGSNAIRALDDVYERWDGRGLPEGRAGDQIDPVARIVNIAEQVVIGHFAGGAREARQVVQRRAGGHLDPDIVAEFLRHSDDILGALDAADMLAAAVAAEPEPAATIDPRDIQRAYLALAIFTDLKGTHLIGHSPHVAELATTAAHMMGMPKTAASDLHAAALLHDIGRTAVSSAIWERAGPLGPADLERVRLHTYWTERILVRCPSLRALARTAAAHHERIDGSGYHRNATGSDLGPPARVLAAADAFAAMTESRPHRPPLPPDAACHILLREAATGKFDPAAAGSVIEAAGLPRPRPTWPCGLTEREVEVLRLCARGLSNRAIADNLVVSARTVQHHLGSIYDKTGRRTRAGAAVFAMEHGLATW